MDADYKTRHRQHTNDRQITPMKFYRDMSKGGKKRGYGRKAWKTSSSFYQRRNRYIRKEKEKKRIKTEIIISSTAVGLFLLGYVIALFISR